MRYLRLLALLAFVYWTYCGVNQNLAVSVYTHSVIQEDLQQIIRAAITDALPDAQDIRFYKMSTENLDADAVVANFIYGYRTINGDNSDFYEIEGRALLNRYSKKDEAEAWSLDKIMLEKEAIEFENPVVIEVE